MGIGRDWAGLGFSRQGTKIDRLAFCHSSICIFIHSLWYTRILQTKRKYIIYDTINER